MNPPTKYELLYLFVEAVQDGINKKTAFDMNNKASLLALIA